MEREKKLKSVATEFKSSAGPNEVTSFTGRLGMSCGSQEKSLETRVKFGKNVAPNSGESSVMNTPSATSVRLG